jgi:hypothetical protein
MDFIWVAQDDSNAIQNAIVDAKGDLIAASANDTPARLAVGANGETLVADSSTSTGLRYTAGTVSDNPVINSCLDIWQRGTSFSAAGLYYFADRWQQNNGGTAITVSRVVTGDTTNLPFIQYAARLQRTAASISTDVVYVSTSFESTNSIPFAGKPVTISWYARVGANWSGGNPGLNLFSGTGTDQNLNSGFTGSATVATTSNTLTTTWQRFSATGTVAATATQLAFQFAYAPSGTAGAADWIEFTGVQLDVGSVALPVRRNGATIQGELAACQRYYYHWTSGADKEGAIGFYQSSTALYLNVSFPVSMRITPTLVAASGTNFYYLLGAGGYDNFNSVAIFQGGTNNVNLRNTTEASGTAGYAGLFGGSASSSIAFTSEL